MKGKRAAIYARVSTTNGQDVGLQIDELHEVARQRGYKVTEFVDEGLSGAKGERERPGLERLMTAVRSGKVLQECRFKSPANEEGGARSHARSSQVQGLSRL